jgi:hypothetical protein
VADTILLVFEGEKTEPGIFDNIKSVFFNNNPQRIVYAIFGTNILKLWKELKDDPYFETIEKLKDIAVNKDKLKDLTRDNVSEIHLFFDFEGHLPEKSLEDHCNIVCAMLEFFDEETDHGRLWFSYPMVEALKHAYNDLAKCFYCIHDIVDNTNYKEKINEINDFQDVRCYSFKPHWRYIIATNIRKAICLVNCSYSMPAYTDVSLSINQLRIFDAQKKRFILRNSTVVVLSAFPFFLLHYFGMKLYNEIYLEEINKKCKFEHITGKELAPRMILSTPIKNIS